MARPTKAKALERLRKALNEIPKSKKTPRDRIVYKKWIGNTNFAITDAFGNRSKQIYEFHELVKNSVKYYDSMTERKYLKIMDIFDSMIESMIDHIEKYWKEEEISSNLFSIKSSTHYDENKIFVIHGRDEATQEKVSRFLERLGFEPVVLHEKPNQGRTIIEKFEDYADVGFAVILLTPDDVGALAGNEDELEPRARQNVILELGFFLGKLGRDRVCPLVKGDVEWPSDYDGVVYTDFDGGGGWKMKLGQELNAAGFNVDMNRAFQT